MAQIIKHRRGSLESLSTVTGSLQKGEIVLATGSANLTTINGTGLAFIVAESGSVQAANRFLMGSANPNIFSASTYNGMLKGVPYYASGSSTLFLLGSDGNQAINLVGNIQPFSGSVNTRLGDLEASIGGAGSGIGARVTNLETISASYLAFTSSYYTDSSSVATQFSASAFSATAHSASEATVFNTLSGSVYTQFSASGASITSLSASVAVTNNGQTDRLGSIETYTSSLKDAITVAGSGTGSTVTIKGNLLVQGTQTTVDSTTINLGDNVLQLNAAGTADGGLVVRDATGESTISGSLLWDVTNDYWKAGALGSEKQLANVDFVSTSVSTLSQSVDARLDTIENSIGTGGSLGTRVSNLETISASYLAFTSSYYIDSSSFDTRISASVAGYTANSASAATSFSASLASQTALSSSISTTNNTQTDNILTNSASSAGAFASASAFSSSAATSFSASIFTTTINSASIASTVNTLSGSVYTQFSASTFTATVNSASAGTSISASNAQIAALSASVASTTGDFSGSIYTQFSASVFTATANSASSATSFSASLASQTALSASISTTNNTQTDNISTVSASAWGAFQTASANSSSAATSFSASIFTATVNSSSAATSFSASLATAVANSASAATNFNTLSGSAYTQFSASAASVLTNSASSATSFSASLASQTALSASNATTDNEQTDRIGALESYSSSLKSAIELTGSNVTIQGDLLVRGTTTSVNSTTIQLGDNIIELNGTGATNGGLLVKDPTAPNTVSGSLLWDSTNDYWKAGALGAESKLLRETGDNVFTSSIQTALSGTFGYNTYSQSVATSFSASNASIASATGNLSSSVATSFSASLASQTALSASISTTNNTQTDNITTNSASAAGAFASASAYSASAATSFSASLATITANSASAATSFSASLAAQNALSTSVDSRLDTLEGTGTIQGVGTTNNVSFNSVTASLNVPGGSSTKRLAFRGLTDNIEFIVAPTQSGDIAQWNGTDFVMSNTIDGGSF